MKLEMLLHQDRLLELIYSVRDDILIVIVDSYDNVQGAEAEHSFLKLSEALRFYDIKNVFIDLKSSSAHLLEDYIKMSDNVVLSGNVLTRIKKVAWVASEYKELYEKAVCRCLLPLIDKDAELNSFQDKLRAFSWLKGEGYAYG